MSLAALNIPPSIAEKIVRGEEKILEYVRINEKKLPQANPLFPASFIDGSYVVSERRGCLVSLLSTASLAVDEGGFSLKKGLPGNRRPFPAIVFPKEYGENRVSYMMKTLEILAALWEIGRGAGLVVLDGSYLTLLLSSFGFPVEVARRGGEPLDEGGEVVNAFERWGELLLRGGGADSFVKVSEEMLNLYGELLFRSGGGIDPLRLSTYVVLTGLLKASHILLEAAEERGVGVAWLSKDVDSRFLVETAAGGGWINDVSVLDEAWHSRGDVYLSFSPDKPVKKPSQPVADPEVLDALYEKWGGYLVAYVKLGRAGVPLQVSVPARMSSLLDAILSTLKAIPSTNGYPNPLVYVHHLAVLKREAAELVANTLWRSAEGKGIIERLLAPKGRVMVGLPG